MRLRVQFNSKTRLFYPSQHTMVLFFN